MTLRVFTVEIFCQGRGWQRIGNVAPVKGVFGTEEDARLVGAKIVLEAMKRSTTQRYGSSIGDMVGFRVIRLKTEEAPEPLEQSYGAVSWDDVKHLFDKRHMNVYFLVKTWTFPD